MFFITSAASSRLSTQIKSE